MKEQLLRKLLKVSLDTVENMLPNLLQTIYEVTSCKMCSLWKINQRANFLSVQARKGYDSISPDKDEFILSVKDSLLGHLVTELSGNQQPYIDIPSIRETKYWEKIKHKEFFANRPYLNRVIVISIPTLPASSSEQPYAEAILAIYPKDNDGFKSDCPEIIRDYFSLALSRLNLIKREQLVQDITHRYEKRATKDLASILYPIVNEELKKYFGYEGCSVFQWDPFLNRLSLVQTTGMDKPAKKQEVFYYLEEGLTGYIAQRKEMLIIDDLDTQRPKGCPQNNWQEKTDHPAKTFAGIPIMSPSRPNELLGVIRFTNRLNPLAPIVDYFNEQDIALIQQACKLIALYLQNEQNERTQIADAKKMVHDMMTPTVAIRGTAHRLLKRRKWSFFPEEKIDSYLRSILEHIELQIALTRNVPFSKRIDARQTHYQQVEQCDFKKDILEHCKKLVIPTVAELELPFEKILIKGVFPQLFIGKFAFQQIFLNLLTNAVKYRDLESHNKFQIVIRGHGYKTYEIPVDAQGCAENIGRQQKGFLFSVEDYGMGIERAQKDKIFRMGYRIHGIEERDVRGLGMGLAIVDQILKDFYGNIWLSNFLKPTMFDIFLPEKLQSNEYTETDEWKTE